MATTRGCFGKVKSGATPDLVGEVRNWSSNESAERIDASVIGTCQKKFVAGAVETTVDLQCWWDPADTGQGNFAIGQEVAVELYPGGDASSAVYYSGTMMIDSIQRTGGVDGIVENNMSGTINGGLTEQTVP